MTSLWSCVETKKIFSLGGKKLRTDLTPKINIKGWGNATGVRPLHLQASKGIEFRCGRVKIVEDGI